MAQTTIHPHGMAGHRHHHRTHRPPPRQRHQDLVGCHYMCTGGPGAQPETKTLHGVQYTFEEWWHEDALFVLRHGQWVPGGTLHVDSTAYTVDAGLGVGWGRFTLTHSELGDFEGTWTWDFGNHQDGHGLGLGTGASTGRHIEITFLIEDPKGLPEPPVRPCDPMQDPQLNGPTFCVLRT